MRAQLATIEKAIRAQLEAISRTAEDAKHINQLDISVKYLDNIGKSTLKTLQRVRGEVAGQ
jgi:hypothetical protein